MTRTRPLHRRQLCAVSTAVVLGLAGSVLPLVTSGAAAAPAPAAPALVRSGHFSPDVAAVDVYLTGFAGGATALWISSEGYGQVSAYRQLTPGLYVVSMRPHGAAASTPATLSWTIEAASGRAYTAAAIGRSVDLKAQILTDDTTTPPSGQGRVRVIQAASLAPTATVTANGGITVAEAVPFGGTTGYRAVKAGTWDLRAVASAPGLVASGAVSVPSGTASTVVLLDTTAGGLTLRTVVDSAGPTVVPVGSVDAGGGGTAAAADPENGTRVGLIGLGALVAVAFVVLLALGVRRRRRTS